MKKINILFVLFVAGLSTPGMTQESSPPPVTWSSKWDNGYKIASSDGNFKMKFGGRIMLDFLAINPDSYYDSIITFNKGVEFRRIRFFNQGTIYNSVSYKLQFDFAVGHAILKDAYINLSKIPVVGNLRIGHFKEPIGLELITSSKYITFMERGLTNPLTPERNTGLILFNHTLNKRITWALGYFLPSNSSGFGLYAGNKSNITGRITGVPILREGDKTKLLHLGLSLTHQNQDNSKYILTSRPETHLAPKLILAEIDVAKAVNQYGLEAAYIHGPFSIQGEYISAIALTGAESILQNDSYNFQAYYGYASWFITGESRKYKLTTGEFDRVKPKNNFGQDGGFGAFEIGARYSFIDLDDTDVNGGSLSDITLGLNWYLNPVTRFMFNYIIDEVKGSKEFPPFTKFTKGKIKGYQFRFQIDF